MGALLLLALLVLLAAALPTWPHSVDWGYGPSGLLGVMLLALIAWLIFGRRPETPDPGRAWRDAVRMAHESNGHSAPPS